MAGEDESAVDDSVVRVGGGGLAVCDTVGATTLAERGG